MSGQAVLERVDRVEAFQQEETLGTAEGRLALREVVVRDGTADVHSLFHTCLIKVDLGENPPGAELRVGN